LPAPGRSRIDRVAGPVGEALIMTAAGLAVAIPAVLAYNVFGRMMAASRPTWKASRATCANCCYGGAAPAAAARG
jgi:biopolymer transport protein ExbB/TolQ